jgi:hypothetical protein
MKGVDRCEIFHDLRLVKDSSSGHVINSQQQVTSHNQSFITIVTWAEYLIKRSQDPIFSKDSHKQIKINHFQPI